MLGINNVVYDAAAVKGTLVSTIGLKRYPLFVNWAMLLELQTSTEEDEKYLDTAYFRSTPFIKCMVE